MNINMEAKKLREDERILQAIDKCISSRDDQFERNRGILKEILEDVFTTMKGRDSLFRVLYQGFFFVEDHYTYATRVDKTREFDVNIVIKFPLDSIHISFLVGELSSRKLTLPNNKSIYTSQWQKYKSFLSTWLRKEPCGESFDIDKHVFRDSIGSLLAQAILNVPKIDNYTIKFDENNPFTLCINKQGFPEFNVSFLPVIAIEYWHPTIEDMHCYAVPEVLQNIKDEHLHWAMAFYDDEDDLLRRHSYIKPAIRQIEKLRDTQGWDVIPYYHIKTLFMHYAIDIENDSGLPDSSKLTGIKLFIHILGKLKNVCESRDLKNCYDRTRNLVDADEGLFPDIVEKLTVIIREITNDPAKVVDWLLTSEELDMYENELKAIGNV